MHVTSTVKKVRKNVSFGKIDTAFLILDTPEMEFKEFEPRFNSAKIRQNPGLNLVPA